MRKLVPPFRPLLRATRSLHFAPSLSPNSSPHLGVNSHRRGGSAAQTYKSSMIGDLPIAKEAPQQGEGVVGQGRIHKNLLPIQGLNGATGRQAVVVPARVDYLGVKLVDAPQAQARAPVGLVQRLAKNELTAVRTVSDVEPVIHGAEVTRGVADHGSRRPRVDAANDDIRFLQPPAFLQVGRHRLPLQSPKYVQSIYQHHHFVKSELRPTERLP